MIHFKALDANKQVRPLYKCLGYKEATRALVSLQHVDSIENQGLVKATLDLELRKFWND